jgi:glycosyltransferase XagB
MRYPREPETAGRLLSRGQVVCTVAFGTAAAALLIGVFGWLALLKTAVALTIVFYVVFVGFKFVLWWAASRSRLPRYPVPEAGDPGLPRYTILVPLCREANVIDRLVQALAGLRYPAENLQILLILEEYDTETRAAVAAADLPGHFEVLVAPDAGPRTKPKACNFGYAHATGDLVVIFDAEDRPQVDQLLRAVGGFRATARDPRVGCLQAQLAFWNPRGSWISSFYWAEYVTHFRWALVGMTRLGLIPPLGGTSNHFRIEALRAVARANGAWEFEDRLGQPVTMPGPWDPYNVTEDADLAFRLALAGYRIGMLDSVTYEEAPDTAGQAKNQRSRWLQGYAQTGLAHTRHPLAAMRDTGPLRYLSFILFMLGTPASLLLNPLMWATTILYVVARLDSLTAVSAFIDGLFPAPVFYAGAVVAIAGNAVLYGQMLVTPLRQQQQSELIPDGTEQHPLARYLHGQEYGLVALLLLTPLWWAFTSVSAYRALRKLLRRSGRSSWDKTAHGHALATELELELELELASLGPGVAGPDLVGLDVGDAQAGVGLVAPVHRDQVGGQRFHLAAVPQPARVDAAHPGDPPGQRLHQVRRVPVVAEYQHVQVELADLGVEQQHGRHVVERTDHVAGGQHGRRLLGGAAFRHRDRVGAVGVERDRVHAVDHDLAFERPGQLGQQVAMTLPGHRRDHQVGLAGGVLVDRAGHLRRVADRGRRRGRASRVARADDHPLAGQGQPAGQAAALIPGTAQDPDRHPGGSLCYLVLVRHVRGSHPMILVPGPVGHVGPEQEHGATERVSPWGG